MKGNLSICLFKKSAPFSSPSPLPLGPLHYKFFLSLVSLHILFVEDNEIIKHVGEVGRGELVAL